MRKVYLQFNEDGTYLSQNIFMAEQGFKSFGYELQSFHFDELSDLELSKEDVVVGFIGTVQKALLRLGVTAPLPIQPPEELKAFLKREQWKTTLGEIRRLERLPVFIKPLYGSKSFTGHVIYEFKDLIRSTSFPNDFEVMAQDALDIVSEWRVYVIKQEVKGIAHYNGSPLALPKANYIQETIAKYAQPPLAYGIDFAVTKTGETVLLEINDAYGIGNYGLADYHYARLLETRWDELVNS